MHISLIKQCRKIPSIIISKIMAIIWRFDLNFNKRICLDFYINSCISSICNTLYYIWAVVLQLSILCRLLARAVCQQSNRQVKVFISLCAQAYRNYEYFLRNISHLATIEATWKVIFVLHEKTVGIVQIHTYDSFSERIT